MSQTTLVVGTNGTGKSTLLDALCFVLFNRPFRIIKKEQMVNTINQSDCLVEVEFDVCVMIEPTSAPLVAIEDVRPTVTLLENVSIGFSGNLFLISLMFRTGL